MQTIQTPRSEDSASGQRSVIFPVAETCRTRPTMNGAADIFESHRSRLFGVAYRMLRTRADAEDVLQDVYLRWHETTKQDIESPIAFLITITTRLCLDRLRYKKKEREAFAELSLSELFVEDYVPSPEEQCEVSGDVSAAFLAVLERLGSEERAAFLLREVFEYDYPEVAQILGKSESACRQLLHRSRTRLRDSRARFAITPECLQRVFRKFRAGAATGDRHAVLALLSERIDYVRAPSPVM